MDDADDWGPVMLADWEMEYRGYIFGGDRDLRLIAVDGVLSSPDVSSSDRARLLRHGMAYGTDWVRGRAITITAELVGDKHSGFAAKVAAVKQAFTVGGGAAPLKLMFPTVANGYELSIDAVVRRVAWPIGGLHWLAHDTVTIELWAGAPWFTSAPTVKTVTLPVASGGGQFDAQFDFGFGIAGHGGLATVNNAGNWPAPVTIRVDGPLVNPRVENLTTGQTLALDMTIPAGSFVLFNSDTRSVLLNGTASRYGSLSAGSEWFDLAPGTNEISFRAVTATEGTASIICKSAWI